MKTCLHVPVGAEHNITNTSESLIKLYSVYGFQEHKDGVTQKTKDISEQRYLEERFDRVTME